MFHTVWGARVRTANDIMAPMQNRLIRFVSQRPVVAQIFKFLISGGVVAVTELALLYLFTDIVGIWYLFSLVLAFTISFFVSFTLQKFWTFEDKEKGTLRLQLSVYLFVALADLAINAILLYVLVEFFGIWYLWAQVPVYGVIALLNFLIYKFIIFKKSKTTQNNYPPSHDSSV